MVTSTAWLYIVADGWAGNYNPLKHPLPHTQTLAGAEMRLFTHRSVIVLNRSDIALNKVALPKIEALPQTAV